MSEYTLRANGDKLEKYACEIGLLPENFPSYESFWKQFVVPLTYREIKISDMRIRADKDFSEDLNAVHVKICIAQLHYSVLANLIIAYEIILGKIDYSKSGVDLINLNHFFTRIFASIDIAYELIVRYKDLTNLGLDPWDDNCVISPRKKFRENTEPDLFKRAREYRNRLVHGRLMPGFSVLSSSTMEPFIPKIGREKNYLDWRKITNEYTEPENFQPASELMKENFELTLNYLDKLWQENLL